MALAAFFDKTALAASQVLQQFSYDGFTQHLRKQVVGVVFDASAVASAEGRISIELLVNLLARLYPVLVVSGLGLEPSHEDFLSRMEQLASAINPNIELRRDIDECLTCIVAVGRTPVESSVPVIYVGSDGWLVKLSQSAPVGSCSRNLPFGAAAAACFGAAGAFRRAFADQLPGGGPDENFELSLVSFKRGDVTSNPVVEPVDIGEVQLVGLGAIGNAVVWTLANFPDLVGRLHLIDNEVVDLTNLQRYVLTRSDSVGQEKTAIAAYVLRESSIKTEEYVLAWEEYLGQRSNWNFNTIMAAVDSAEVRQDIQASLPRCVLNAWTQPAALGVSRHYFVDEQACLSCLYYPHGPGKNEDEVIAQALGLPDEPDVLLEVRRRLKLGTPTERMFIERIASALQIDCESLLRFEGIPLRRFYSEAVCGGVTLSLGATHEAGMRVEAPMAFQSCLAGILLASELIARAARLREPGFPVKTSVDLLKPLGVHLSQRLPKVAKCICRDSDYIIAYREKYSDIFELPTLVTAAGSSPERA